MSNSKTKNFLTGKKPFSYKYLLILGLIFGVVGVLAYRQNNITALRLRDTVLEADKNNGDVETALKELREFTYSHMNANLSSGTGTQHPIQLVYRYERLVQVEKDRVAKANEQIYTEAQRFCEKKYPGSFSGGPRVPCIEDYVTKNGEKEKPIPDDFYKFDFVAPTWSFDLAGISLALSGLFLALFFLRFTLDKWLKHELKKQLE